MRTPWIPALLATTMLVVAPIGTHAAADPDAIRYREVTLPAGTVIPIVLDSYVASDTSRMESPVRAHVRRPVYVRGAIALPAGSALIGHVTRAERGGRVHGRASLAFRFDRLSPGGSNQQVAIRTSAVSRTARSTKSRDARTIAIPAAGGAIVGALVGGQKGAAIGAAAGGGGGTAVALSTRGPEVRLGRGAVATVTLMSPVTVRIKA